VQGEIDSWTEYRRLILQALERLDGEIGRVNSKIDAMREDDIAALKVKIAMLEVKAGMWGALMGLVTGALAVLVAYLK
jgi:hypothetical protein